MLHQKQFLLTLAACLAGSLMACCRSGAQELGSTATLEQLRSPKVMRDARKSDSPDPVSKPGVIVLDSVLSVTPANLASPALQYRLIPSVVELRPGEASIVYGRCLQWLRLVPAESVSKRNEMEMNLGENEIPTAESIREVLAPYQQLFAELDRLRTVERLEWDIRIRDQAGLERFRILLPEVQESREMARLLRFRILEQLQSGEFDGAIRNMQTGYRLSRLMATGESLVHQLVAIAIEGTMQGCVEQAIRTPGCPNLYYALAIAQRDIAPVIRALDLELDTVQNAFEVLRAVDNESWSQEQWVEAWRRSIDSFSSDVREFGSPGPQNEALLRGLVGAGVSASAAAAKEKLKARGLDPRWVESLIPERAAAIELKLAIRESTEPLAALARLPWLESRRLLASSDRNPQPGAASGPAGIITGLLMPAVSQIFEAHYRTVARHNMLMNIEAVRDFMARNEGTLPASLDQIEQVPVMRDPNTGLPVRYEMAREDDAAVGAFSIESRVVPESYRTIRIRLAGEEP